MVVAFTTEWLAPETETRSHSVSAPDASSPASLMEVPSHSVQTLDLTYWSAAHVVLSHAVLAPDALSPAALVVPAAHVAQALEETYWLAAHKVASQVVVAPLLVLMPPAGRVVPAAHALHVPWVATSAPFAET